MRGERLAALHSTALLLCVGSEIGQLAATREAYFLIPQKIYDFSKIY